jgi:hypothetical protein
MFPEIKPLAEPIESANRFLTVLFRSIVPQRPVVRENLGDEYWGPNIFSSQNPR